MLQVRCSIPYLIQMLSKEKSIVDKNELFILLAAESMGLGGCWIHIRDRMHNDTKTAQEYISEIVHIPEKLKVESMIALGYPDEKKPHHKKEELQYEKVYFNLYGEVYTL